MRIIAGSLKNTFPYDVVETYDAKRTFPGREMNQLLDNNREILMELSIDEFFPIFLTEALSPRSPPFLPLAYNRGRPNCQLKIITETVRRHSAAVIIAIYSSRCRCAGYQLFLNTLSRFRIGVNPAGGK